MGTVKQLTSPASNPSGQAISLYDSEAWTNSDVISAAPCTWLTASGENKGNATLYIMFFDATTVPANGAAPLGMPIQLPSGQAFQFSENDTARAGQAGTSETGLRTTTGLCWAASSTPATLTVDTTASIWLQATFA
jgi:hypothetical protein